VIRVVVPHLTCLLSRPIRCGVGPGPGGAADYSTFASTVDDGTNPGHYQQQIVASVAVP